MAIASAAIATANRIPELISMGQASIRFPRAPTTCYSMIAPWASWFFGLFRAASSLKHFATATLRRAPTQMRSTKCKTPPKRGFA